MPRYTPKKRTALDGRVWWCVYDNSRHRWSTDTRHGRYRTRKAAMLKNYLTTKES